MKRLRTVFALIFSALLPLLILAYVETAPTWTGSVPADYIDADTIIFPDPGGVGDVFLPVTAPPGTVSGWDMVAVYFDYDHVDDTMYVGIDCAVICGDADGDGDPANTSAWLAANSGNDAANLDGTESFTLILDTNNDYVAGNPTNNFDVAVGVRAGADISTFGTYSFLGGFSNPALNYGPALPNMTLLFANPAFATPDLEFSVADFSTLPGFTFTPGESFAFQANLFAGSLQDDGIGEDFLPAQRVPISVTIPPPIPAAVGNYVWLDENSDGYQDAGEPGIPNVVVNLTDSAGIVSVRLTDAHGGYLFGDLDPGTYTVTIPALNFAPGGSLEGLTQTTAMPIPPQADFGNQLSPYVVTVAGGEENLTADFGYNWRPTDDVDGGTNEAALGDRVWVDVDGDGAQDPEEVGIADVKLNLIEAGPDLLFGTADDVVSAMQFTDANGNYMFDDLAPGAYQVQVDASNALPGGPLDGYAQTGDPDDFGQPATAPDGLTTTPVILGPGDVFLNADFGYRPDNAQTGTIGDLVWFDANASGTPEPIDGGEYGIPGVTVSLIKDTNGDGVWTPLGADGNPGTVDDEPVIGTDTTDGNGRYLFSGLPLDDGDGDADYIVWVNDTDNVLGGLTQTYDADGVATADVSATALSAGTPVDLDQDFSYTPIGHSAPRGLVGDTIWLNPDGDAVQDPGEPGIEGVIVQLTRPDGTIIQTITNENGNYYFPDLDPAATYKVTVAASNFAPGGPLDGLAITADPDGPLDGMSTVDLSVTGPVDLDQDFGYTPPAGEENGLGNLVWLDIDADGVYDPADGETPIGGVTLDLYRDLNGDGAVNPGEPLISSTTTDSAINAAAYGPNGNYLFTGLPDGDYVVDVTDKAAVLFGYWHSLGATGVSDNSQVDPYAASVSGGTRNLTADFGYYLDPGSVGDFVWYDLDGDGVQDAGEPGIPNARVELAITYPDGTVTRLATLTDANGGYGFGNLLLDEDYDGVGTYATPGVGGGDEPVHVITATGPAGYAPSPIGATTDDLDSDDSVNGETAEPTQGGNDPTNDFGFFHLDLGDLPDAGAGTGVGDYETLLANNGPSHSIWPAGTSGAIHLGALVDTEPDGLPVISADGDDTDGADDEDGVTFNGDNWLPTNVVSITVEVSAVNPGANIGLLGGWFDWDRSGDFTPDEFYFWSVDSGSQDLFLTVGAAFDINEPLYARFRLFDPALVPGGTIDPGDALGPASNGEVEDYRQVFPVPTAVTLQQVGVVPAAAGGWLPWLALALATCSGWLWRRQRRTF